MAGLNILNPRYVYNPENYIKDVLGKNNIDQFIKVAIFGWVYFDRPDSARKLMALLPAYGLDHLVPKRLPEYAEAHLGK